MKLPKTYIVKRGYAYGSDDVVAVFDTYAAAKRSASILNKKYQVKGIEKFYVQAHPVFSLPISEN